MINFIPSSSMEPGKWAVPLSSVSMLYMSPFICYLVLVMRSVGETARQADCSKAEMSLSWGPDVIC